MGELSSALLARFDVASKLWLSFCVCDLICTMRHVLLEGARGCPAPQLSALRCPLCFGRRSIARATALATAATAAPTSTAPGKHYVVVGAGLAGLATTYHLLKQSPLGAPVHVTVYDAVGIGAGGSGAAAGLLHPFAPTGKLLWRGQDAMQAALELLEAAEAAAVQDPGLPDCIAWRTGMLKAATSIKQSQSFWKLYGTTQQQQQQQALDHDRQAGLQTAAAQLESMLSAAVVGVSTAQQLVPGVQLPVTTAAAAAGQATDNPQQLACGLHEAAASTRQEQQAGQQHQPHRRRRKQMPPAPAPPADWSAEQSAALYVQAGITLQPQHYLQALWLACQQTATARLDGSSAQLRIQQLQSLTDVLLPQQHVPGVSSTVSSNKQSQQDACDQPAQQQRQQQQQHVDGIVVAAGAAVGSLAEIGQQLPLKLCQGYTLDMVPPAAAAAATAGGAAGAAAGSCSSHPSTAGAAAEAAAAYPASGPSLLGTPYLASQGGQVLVVGATKQYNCSSQQALAELGRTIDPRVLSAQQQLQPAGLQSDAAGSLTGEQIGQGGADCAAAAGGDKAAEVAAAAAELVAGAATVWPGVGGWSIGGIRSGVRAIPPRLAAGALPIAGRWMDLRVEQQQQQQAEGQQQRQQQQQAGSIPVWLLAGLGARGLVYHAWLGQLLAASVLSGGEEQLPPELLAWRGQQAPSAASSTEEQ